MGRTEGRVLVASSPLQSLGVEFKLKFGTRIKSSRVFPEGGN